MLLELPDGVVDWALVPVDDAPLDVAFVLDVPCAWDDGAGLVVVADGVDWLELVEGDVAD